MNEVRMERLAKFIEKLPPETFSMRDWVVENGFGKRTETVVCSTDVLNSCGTACCIAGWQALQQRKCLIEDGWLSRRGKKTGRHCQEFALEHLGLTTEEGYNLFYKEDWPLVFKSKPDSPQLAAARIRYMIKWGL